MDKPLRSLDHRHLNRQHGAGATGSVTWCANYRHTVENRRILTRASIAGRWTRTMPSMRLGWDISQAFCSIDPSFPWTILATQGCCRHMLRSETRNGYGISSQRRDPYGPRGFVNRLSSSLRGNQRRLDDVGSHDLIFRGERVTSSFLRACYEQFMHNTMSTRMKRLVAA